MNAHIINHDLSNFEAMYEQDINRFFVDEGDSNDVPKVFFSQSNNNNNNDENGAGATSSTSTTA